MKLVIELPTDRYEQFVASLNPDFAVPVLTAVTGVEVRQEGGLLATPARAGLIEALTPHVADTLGVPAGGPALRLWLRPQEETDERNGHIDRA